MRKLARVNGNELGVGGEGGGRDGRKSGKGRKGESEWEEGGDGKEDRRIIFVSSWHGSMLATGMWAWCNI